MPPTALVEALNAVRRRVRALAAIYGGGVVATVAIALFLTIALLDYALNLPATPRLLIDLIAIFVLIYALRTCLVRPMLCDLSISDVAGRLEQFFPQFGDRLRSTIEFMRGSVPGSPAMQRRVIEQASSIAGGLDLRQAVVAKPAYFSASSAASAAVILVLLCFALPQYARIAWARMTSPLAAHPWPKRVEIQLFDKPKARLPVGQHVELHMRLARGDNAGRKASVIYQFGDGSQQRELMTRNADGTYSASLDTHVDAAGNNALLKVKIEAGDDDLILDPITIVPRLAIKEVIAQITPPAYVPQRKQQSVNLAATPAVLAEGSTLSLRVAFNKPLVEDGAVEVVPGGADGEVPAVAWSHLDPHTSLGQWSPRKSLRFHLRATDADSFSNNALEDYEVIVRPDVPPSIQIDSPRRNEERTADAIVPLSGLAEDDYGLSAINLIAERSADKRQWQTPLLANAAPTNGATVSTAETSADRQRARIDYAWKLSDLSDAKLQPGDSLEYHLEAKDNFVLGSQTHPPVSSGRLRIVIISQEDLASRVSDDLRQLKQQLTAVRANQDRNRQETTGLLDDTKKKPQLDTADATALDRLTDQQAAAAAQTKQLSDNVAALNRRLTENRSPSQELSDLTRDLAQQLQQTAESSMKDAAQQLSAVKQEAAKPDARNYSLDTAASLQQQASDQLQQAMDRMSNIGSLSTTVDNLKKLLDAQEQVNQQTVEAGKDNLGKTPAQMSAGDREKLQQAADAQAKLADRTAKALDEMQKLAAQMAKSDPAAAEALKKAAATGQQQQVAANQKKAADSARQNQQSLAQASQKQVELGLQQMLGNLREAEQHRLAELQKQLEELQAQIANLVRRQAGHNLDDVTLQGAEALKKMDAGILADLTMKSQRGATSAPPTIPGLSSGQEQTEQNTRDITKLADSGGSGNPIAANLTRAAGKMERAVVALKDAKLSEAYDPSQVDALAALDSARKLVDEQKAKLDAQVDDQQAEAVRDQFVKIREEQVKVNEQTISIDKTRAPGGALNRLAAVKLAQLPEQQSKLAKRVNKIDEALTAAGSTVFIWANKDIARRMTSVRDQLSNRESGVPVQADQTGVVDELDAMIRNLVTKPKQSKFAADSPASGGGAAGKAANPGPKLPSEAELRLLQDFQKSVNAATKQLNVAQKDQAALLDLSNRQAEYRGLLDQLLQKASRGETKLPPEPDNKDALPEEAKTEDIENNELDKDLLAGVAADQRNEAESNLVGDRMARSRQRLGLNHDPGQVTQAIQARIITDLDYLIDQARKQQAEQRHAPPSQDQQQMAKPQAQPQLADGKPAQQPVKGATPAAQSAAPGNGGHQQDLSADIRQSAAEWGAITPRLRDAAIDSAGENVVESYRKLVEDYYRSVTRQGSGQQ